MSYNIFLSGGGIKGAYQYGFFKQVYKTCPDFKINKLYSVSVGSLNAIPILTKKLHYLEPFWEPKNEFPIQKIFNTWDSVEKLTIHKSLFKSFKKEAIENILDNLTAKEKYIVSKSLTIMSYDKKKKIAKKFNQLIFNEDIVQACLYSSCFPSLVPQIHPYLTDGIFVKGDQFKYHFTSDTNKWIILDLSSTFSNMEELENVKIYQPSELNKHCINSININKTFIKNLVEEGTDHANDFLSNISSDTCRLVKT